MGRGLWGRSGGHSNSGSASPSQPHHYNSRRQLSIEGEETLRSLQTAGGGEIDMGEGGQFSCRLGVKSGCRLTNDPRFAEHLGYLYKHTSALRPLGLRAEVGKQRSEIRIEAAECRYVAII